MYVYILFQFIFYKSLIGEYECLELAERNSVLLTFLNEVKELKRK